MSTKITPASKIRLQRLSFLQIQLAHMRQLDLQERQKLLSRMRNLGVPV
jgi:hypothetical protein